MFKKYLKSLQLIFDSIVWKLIQYWKKTATEDLMKNLLDTQRWGLLNFIYSENDTKNQENLPVIFVQIRLGIFFQILHIISNMYRLINSIAPVLNRPDRKIVNTTSVPELVWVLLKKLVLSYSPSLYPNLNNVTLTNIHTMVLFPLFLQILLIYETAVAFPQQNNNNVCQELGDYR